MEIISIIFVRGVKKLKKYKVFAYIFIIIIFVLAISFGIYKVISSNKNEEQDIVEKARTEIKYIDDKLMVLFNNMNKIQFDNFKLSIKDTNTSKADKSGSSSGSSGDSSESSSGSGNSGEEGSQNKDDGDGKSNTSSSSESIKTYMLDETGILIGNSDIDWKNVKYEVENMYVSLPTITLDLYQTDAQDQDILDLNSEFDNLTKVVKEENKNLMLQQLVKLYEILVKITDKCYDSIQEQVYSRTKLNIYKAYSKLDSNNWNDIYNDTKMAVDEFSKLMTDSSISNNKQYSINKIYVMLSELQKASEKQDVQIFLIKYKNTLEELNNL